MSDQWIASAQCPQCGGEVTIEVGDPVLSCGYCRTNLYIAPDGPLTYRLPVAPEHEDAAKAGELFHLPYWRLRGISYRVAGSPPRVEGGLLDITAPATDFIPLGSNLGIRPQAARMILSPSLPDAIEPTLKPERVAFAESGETFFKERGELFSRLIGEVKIVIQAPHMLLDTPEGWVLREAFPDGRDISMTEEVASQLKKEVERPKQARDWTFLPLTCPNCAHGLAPAAGAVALLCTACRTAWFFQGRSFKRVPFVVMGHMEDGDRLFPFWNILFTAEGVNIVNRSDLIRWSIPYRPVPKGWEEETPALFIPGFKLSPNTFMRVSKAMTLLMDEPSHEELPVRAFVEAEPVRLPLMEAVEALKLSLAYMSVAKGKDVPDLAVIEPKVSGARLAFIPFSLVRNEWLHKPSGQAISAASVRHGSAI